MTIRRALHRQRIRSVALGCTILAAAAPAIAEARNPPAITVAEPEGFSNLTSERTVVVDVYFGGAHRGEAQIMVTPGAVTIVDPEAVVELLPQVANRNLVTSALGAERLPANSELVCAQGSDRRNCGRLAPETVGVIQGQGTSMTTMMKTIVLATLAFGSALGLASPAFAEMVLSQVIVDLLPGKPPRQDIEVWNDGAERMYVVAEPSEIHGAGTPQEQRGPAGLPEESGILVSPQRLVLEPGERRTVRIAAIGERPGQDRVYRVAIRPVAGAVSAEESALKVFVGYDTLVLVRPERFTGDVEAQRNGRALVLRNNGNTAQELFEGRQCDSSGGNCQALPAKRLYPGAVWEQTLPFDTPVSYKSSVGPTIRNRQF